MMTTPPLTPETIETLARKRAGAKMGWFVHATVYALVNLFWLARSDLGLGTHPWHLWPSVAWGFGLCLHGMSVWFVGTGTQWHERMVQRERERLQRQQNGL